MAEQMDALRQLSVEATVLRMLLAVFCGGIIGLEREFKRRPAGFRTHILICMGGAMATMTGQYLATHAGYVTDPSRLGAQVIAGIGFIGAGTIIMTRHRRVRGLTTAAGLWAAALVGLSLGSGFYEGAIFATVLILLAEMLFSKIEYHLLQTTSEISIFVEYTAVDGVEQILKRFREMRIKVLHMEITNATKGDGHNLGVIFYLRLHKRCRPEQILESIRSIDSVLSAIEL